MGYQSLLKPIGSWLVFFGIIFIGFFLWKEREDLQIIFAKANYTLLFFSLFLAIIGNVSHAEIFGHLLSNQGITVSKLELYKLYFYSCLTKYIPGKIWTILYQHLAVSHMNNFYAIPFVNLHLMLALVIGSFTFFTAIAFNLPIIFTLLVTIISSAIIVKSNVIDHIKFIIQKLLPENPSKIFNSEPISYSFLLKNFSLLWIFMIISQSLAVIGLFDLNFEDAILLVSFFLVAWIIGTLSIITPAGFGVREVIFIIIGQQSHLELTTNSLLVLALGLRAWQIAHEFLAAFIVLAYEKYIKKQI